MNFVGAKLRSCRTLRAFTVAPCEVRGTPTFYSFWMFLHTFCDIYVKKHILRFYACCIRDAKECKRRKTHHSPVRMLFSASTTV